MLFSLLASYYLQAQQPQQGQSEQKVLAKVCQGPWCTEGFENFQLGMIVEDGEKCLLECRRDRYARITPTNEYEIWPSYSNDYTESRLHPKKILSSVRIRIDQPRPALEILRDVAEALTLCAGGCRILALQERGMHRAEIIVYPTEPTPEHRGSAARIASSWEPSRRQAVRDRLVPLVYLRWEIPHNPCIDETSTPLTWAITELEFTVGDPPFPDRASLKPLDNCDEPFIVDLSVLRP